MTKAREEQWMKMKEWLLKHPQFVNWDWASAQGDLSAYVYGTYKNGVYHIHEYDHSPGEHVDDKTIDGTCTEIPDPPRQLEDKS